MLNIRLAVPSPDVNWHQEIGGRERRRRLLERAGVAPELREQGHGRLVTREPAEFMLRPRHDVAHHLVAVDDAAAEAERMERHAKVVRPSMLETKTRCGRGPTHTIAACKPRRE